MNKLFSEITINSLTVKNRFVRAATWEGLATPDGEVTQKLVDMLVTLATGGVGLIISSHAYVSKEGQGTPWQLGIYSDKLVPKFQELTSAIHEQGCKIILQLAHAGEFAETALTGEPAWSVSGSSGLTDNQVKVITLKDIAYLITSYAQAAKRAKDAGFDGIEIHSAHGYFLSQFLSPAFNHRSDPYGGDIKNKTRIHCEILQAVREAVGSDYPVFIKMNCADFIENGLEDKEALQAAKIFEKAGFDAIEVSGGIIRTGKLSPSRPGITLQDKEAYFRDFARKFKSKLSLPLILVGGIKSFETASGIIEDGIADCISMSRCLIREPNLVSRWQNGDLQPAECKSDNLCFTPGFAGKGVYCVTKEIEENKKICKIPTSQYS
ncbi:MAG: NADH:flavin oxidoreductase [Desulfocapsaceae bacterium]|nr:NADH:flavin oxidoreductase [Desulfocapsaceae bacterium]